MARQQLGVEEGGAVPCGRHFTSAKKEDVCATTVTASLE